MKTATQLVAMAVMGGLAGASLAGRAEAGSGGSAGAARASANSPLIQVRLTGAEESPPVDEGATRATARFQFRNNYRILNFTMAVRAAPDATEAHLHCAPPGAEGPVIVSLFGLGGPATAPLLSLIAGGYVGRLDISANLTDAAIVRYDQGGTGAAAQGCRSTIGSDITNLRQLADAIRNNQIYVNLHSVAHPMGALRAQLRLGNRPATPTGGSSTGSTSGGQGGSGGMTGTGSGGNSGGSTGTGSGYGGQGGNSGTGSGSGAGGQGGSGGTTGSGTGSGSGSASQGGSSSGSTGSTTGGQAGSGGTTGSGGTGAGTGSTGGAGTGTGMGTSGGTTSSGTGGGTTSGTTTGAGVGASGT